jgi:predicted GH43/DUF377 family glycosyl hydrolase
MAGPGARIGRGIVLARDDKHAPAIDGIVDLKHHDVILRPNPARTVIRPFLPSDPKEYEVAGHSRAERIAERVKAMDDNAMARAAKAVTDSLDERHRDVDEMLFRRFDEIAGCLTDPKSYRRDQQRLIGAYLSEEYSFESAALFNPSAVIMRDQSEAPEGGVAFALSLRGIGEGHVSSVTFRMGSWVPGGEVKIKEASSVAVAPVIEKEEGEGTLVHLRCDGSRELSETVLFPILPSQTRGIEDLRLTHFREDDGSEFVHGTYTAFDGNKARSELLTGVDFQSFMMRPLKGDMASAKGMALFPRRLDGRYAMLGRQDMESIWFVTSDDLLAWEGGAKIVSPRYPWEYVQMGNCGAPIELDEGWLVLTHGVGTVRNYCVGACLLDKKDPAKVLARTAEPILQPRPDERDGYVPNVVYSCGSIVHDRHLLLPYGVADSFTAFASVEVDDLLAAMS